jgi:hypothetical protein|tara:strand:- start:2308 stop:2634 length:327 start_codon:yes stop_codon:yes gene_type:complete
MRPEQIEDVLVRLHSGQWFGWSNPTNKVYANLIIHGNQEKPTQEFLESELQRQQAEYDSQEYARNRQAEYPSINELIVALWENVVEERAASVIELESLRQAVKARYPK